MFEVIKEYWLLFLIGQYPDGPIGGLAGTLGLAILCLALALPCSILIAVARISHKRHWRLMSGALVYVMRGTPFLMIVFWSYYLMPVLFGRAVSPFWVMVVALVLYESAYLAEVIRAGIQALPRGQFEGAQALGFSSRKTMIFIILPQALYNSFPALLSQFVSIIKETSLGVVIGVQEFTFAAGQANASLMVQPVEVFSILGITFFIICFAFSSAARLLESRVGKLRGVQAA
jgi:polar amino acid transport system permease protein